MNTLSSGSLTHTSEESNMAFLAHLIAFSGFFVPFGGFLGPLVVWLTKKDESEYIDFHGKESVNFNLSMMIYFFISCILCLVIIGFFMLFALCIFRFVVTIIASIKAKDGEYYEYPLNLRLIK